MSFRDMSWQSRYKVMGDTAEAMFEQIEPLPFVRYGLERPPFSVGELPSFVANTPDYLQKHRLVEVQGCGRDGIIKIKPAKLAAVQDWTLHMDVVFFFWNSHRKEYTYVDHSVIRNMCTEGAVETKQFPEGTDYYAIPVAMIDGWVAVS